jgi:hypothetical protein
MSESINYLSLSHAENGGSTPPGDTKGFRLKMQISRDAEVIA